MLEMLHKNAMVGLAWSLFIIGLMILLIPFLQYIDRRLARLRFKSKKATIHDEQTQSFLQTLEFIKKLEQDMKVADVSGNASVLLAIMLTFSLIGGFVSNILVILMQQWFAVGADRSVSVNPFLFSMIVALIVGLIPYYYVQFKLQQKRHRLSKSLIQCIQNLIGHYRYSLNLIDIIKSSTPTMPDDMRKEWRRLELAITMRSPSEALNEFSVRIGNKWAYQLADILDIYQQYGTDIRDGLHKLVSNMQASKKHEDSRRAVVSIFRWGTLFMVFFTFFTLWFNIFADGTNYKRYFIDPLGRFIVIVNFIIMAISMLLVVRSGKKQF